MYYLNDEESFLRDSDHKFYNPEDGYIKGNMTKSSYYNYRNYEPKNLDLTTEKEKLLFLIGAYYFASHDLRLYLDLNPNDKNVVNTYKKYVKEYLKYKGQYSSKYGPISSLDNDDDVFEYMRCPWPWEGTK